MLIEQIIEFELRGPGFHDKTKISNENLRVDYYLLLKYCSSQSTLLSQLGPNHLQLKFNTKALDFKRVLDQNSKEKDD